MIIGGFNPVQPWGANRAYLLAMGSRGVRGCRLSSKPKMSGYCLFGVVNPLTRLIGADCEYFYTEQLAALAGLRKCMVERNQMTAEQLCSICRIEWMVHEN